METVVRRSRLSGRVPSVVAYSPATKSVAFSLDVTFEDDRGRIGEDLNWIRRLEDWLPLLLFTGLMVSVSTIPDLSPPGDGVFSDKIWHVGEYAGWAILFRRGIDGSRSNATMWPLRMLVTLVVGCLLAVSDENLQRLVGRHYAVDDMVADAVGLVIGLLVYELIRSRLRATRQEEIQQTPGPSREGSTR